MTVSAGGVAHSNSGAYLDRVDRVEGVQGVQGVQERRGEYRADTSKSTDCHVSRCEQHRIWTWTWMTEEAMSAVTNVQVSKCPNAIRERERERKRRWVRWVGRPTSKEAGRGGLKGYLRYLIDI